LAKTRFEPGGQRLLCVVIALRKKLQIGRGTMSGQPSRKISVKFSLKGLLVGCAFAALVLAGWFDAARIWAGLVFLFSFLAILLAVILGLFGPAVRRASRASLALSAAAYLALTVYPGQFGGFPATRLFESLNEKIEPIRNKRLNLPGGMGGMGGGMGGMGGGAIRPNSGTSPYIGAASTGGIIGLKPYPDIDLMLEARANMPRTGNCAVAMLLGLLAAIVGQMAYERSRATRGAD
jgi:hypothetical protein